MDIELTKVSGKGQIVIPSALRRGMNIRKSDKFLVFGEGDTIVLKRVEEPLVRRSFEEVARPLREAVAKAGVTRADLDKAIREVRKHA